MAKQNDNAKIVAEALVVLGTTGAAGAAAVAGYPPALLALAKVVLDCIFKLVLNSASDPADAHEIVQKIRIARTSGSVEIIRESMVTAMAKRPELMDPIDALADAWQAKEQGTDDERFKDALLEFFAKVTQIAETVAEIREDTAVLREDVSQLKDYGQSSLEQTTIIREQLATLSEAIDQKEGRVRKVSEAGESLASIRLETVSEQLRAAIDGHGLQKWSRLRETVEARSWEQAFLDSADLEQWVDDQSDALSRDMKGQLLLMLADVAAIRDITRSSSNAVKPVEAWRLLKKAEGLLAGDCSDDNAQRAIRIRSKLTFLDGDPRSARRLLKDAGGQGAIALELGFLIEEQRWADAANLATSQTEPNERWAELAVVANVRAGNHHEAETILDWCQSQAKNVRHQCVLAYARTSYTALTNSNASANDNPPEDGVQAPLRALQQLLCKSFSDAIGHGPSSGLDAEALELLILLGHVLHDRQICEDAATQLDKWTPVSPELGRAVLREDIAPIAGLAERYLELRPSIFTCTMLAAMLLIEVDDDAERAVNVLLPLIRNLQDDEQREEAGSSLFIASQHVTRSVANSVLVQLEQTFGPEHRLPKMTHAMLLASESQLLEAEDVLMTVVDEQDSLWLQAIAGVRWAKTEWGPAATALAKQGELSQSAEAFRRAAHAWHNADDLSNEIAALERAYQLDPTHTATTRNLATGYHLAKRYDDAVRLYEQLWTQGKVSEQLAVNYANCLVMTGDAKAAIQKLSEFLASSDSKVGIAPLLLLAELLHAEGQTPEAFNVLWSRWEEYRDDHKFLVQVLQLGYASGAEDSAHKALAALIRKLDDNGLPKGILERVSEQDMIGRIQDGPRRRNLIGQSYVSGKIPWILASDWLNPAIHSFLAWHLRTHSGVVVDGPANRAEYTLYCTNGFVVSQGASRELQRIAAPPGGGDIVVDISALMTLYRLDLLDELFSCYEKLIVPLSYRPAWLADAGKITHHQPSVLAERQQVADQVSQGHISIVDDFVAGTPTLDEYRRTSEVNGKIIRLAQLVEWLTAEGAVQDDLATASDADVAVRLCTDDEMRHALKEGRLLATAATLQAAARRGILGSICRSLRIEILRSDWRQIQSDLLAQHDAASAGAWHRDLVERLNQHPNVEFVDVVDSEPSDEPADSKIHYAIDSVLLSQQLAKTLLVDDRTCQQGRYATEIGQSNLAFGTDALISRWAEDGRITGDQATDVYIKLIRWRYRFIFPPVDVLVTMASRFISGLPGQLLREVAVYVQDCMRDPGLFGGKEPVMPPLSMAIASFLRWIDTVAEFIAAVWFDTRFEPAQAEKLTVWAIRHLLPSWPKNLGMPHWHTAAQMHNRAVLVKVFIALLPQSASLNAHTALRTVIDALGIPQGDWASLTESLASSWATEIGKSKPSLKKTAYFTALKMVYGEKPALDWRCLPSIQAFGLKIDERPISDDAAAFADSTRWLSRDAKAGPWIYVEFKGQKVGTFVPEALSASNKAVRLTALEQLLSPSQCPMSDHVRSVLRERAEEIRADSPASWVPAVSSCMDQVESDFYLNASGFIQASWLKHREGAAQCWRRLINPSTAALKALEPPLRSSSNTLGAAAGGIHLGEVQAATAGELLEWYERRAGHLCLSAPEDLGSRLHDWLQEHPDARSGVWSALESWLNDKRHPWHIYHACQALLQLHTVVPHNEQQGVWERIADFAEQAFPGTEPFDAAQIERLEGELAAHYLRLWELGVGGRTDHLAIASAWKAAGLVIQALGELVPLDDLEKSAKTWRTDTLQPELIQTSVIWAWVCPRRYSAAENATLHQATPRSSALLTAIGDFVAQHGTATIPSEARQRLRDCYETVVLISEVPSDIESEQVWQWDHSLLQAAIAFDAALPDAERTATFAMAVGYVQGLNEDAALVKALDQLPDSTPSDALFVCTRARQYCLTHANAVDVMLSKLRDEEWRTACARNLPIRPWELLVEGFLHLQAVGNLDWKVELPFVALKAAEAVADDRDRARFFLMCMVVASISGRTVGAIKATRASERWFDLKPVVAEIREQLSLARSAMRPEEAIRLQDALAVLDSLQ